MRGRMYPWGVVEVENPDHCDFIKLRTLLVFVILSAAICTLLVGLFQQLNTCSFSLYCLFGLLHTAYQANSPGMFLENFVKICGVILPAHNELYYGKEGKASVTVDWM